MTTISVSAPLESRWDMSLPMRQEEKSGVCVCVRLGVCVNHAYARTHASQHLCVFWLLLGDFSAQENSSCTVFTATVW